MVAILGWLRAQAALETVTEANALVAAAGMSALREGEPLEAALLQQLDAQSAVHHRSLPITSPTNLPTPPPFFSGHSAGTAKHNLPAQTMPLLGRAQELAELADLLADPATRLVTILSAGGMGKTHLAVAAALNQVERFANGVCWVALAPLTEAKELVPAIGAALGVQFQGDARQNNRCTIFCKPSTCCSCWTTLNIC